ncbi:uncharacterized protein KNAG_0K00540 [Huiozyma naganishii CBS 8797]|uniref:Peptidase S54 rhomboid domain-containing protein n=1 Tax=Huiozyma naganishii (strain ATCC MYA-139 / BCRC 22969 / CBS 8797 / KCTC 17520 / NBRC 10181 / NCYC 3082 / Yp74L-3) TaxID=1071383 RepID=J7S351_HUIN7|nr:hypothetical protein KNAG_0K00540 [Kazachstania naganishii CBS 8797]CCK72422.1 hypothetical protein KNAG_0K00540 [Kazachstania naganishii CBS 8797]
MQYSTRFFDISVPDSLLDFRQIPTSTKLILSGYVCFSVALFVTRQYSYNQLVQETPGLKYENVVNPVVQLIPSMILKFPYSVVLSNFVDTQFWKFICTLFNLLIGGAYIEKNWSSTKELLKFVLGIGTLTNILMVLITVGIHFCFPDLINLTTPIDGNYTVLIGFPIIYRQLLPETTIINLKSPIEKNFRFKLLPIFIMSVMTIVEIVWSHHLFQLISIWCTFFSCWIYLRFFQPLAVQGGKDGEYIKGDASDTFQLILFFPDVIKPFLKPLFNAVYNIACVRLRIIKPFQLDDIDKGNDIAEQRGAKKVVPVADRRRQLALQVLQERMA